MLLGPGSNRLLIEALRLFCPPGVRVRSWLPTFSLVPDWCLQEGRQFQGVPGPLEGGASWDSLLRTPAPVGVLYLDNPNNPSGFWQDPGTLAPLLAGVDADLILLDEAYADFAPTQGQDLLDQEPRLLILRTFSKALGAAGLRLGYLLGEPGVLAKIRERIGPYPLNWWQVLGVPRAWARRLELPGRLERLRAEREVLRLGLERLGCRVLPSQANFLLFRVPGRSTGTSLAGALARAGVRVRSFGDVGVLAPWLRVTVGRPEENRFFLEALGRVLPGGPA